MPTLLVSSPAAYEYFMRSRLILCNRFISSKAINLTGQIAMFKVAGMPKAEKDRHTPSNYCSSQSSQLHSTSLEMVRTRLQQPLFLPKTLIKSPGYKLPAH
jgi:hypothetical protein